MNTFDKVAKLAKEKNFESRIIDKSKDSLYSYNKELFKYLWLSELQRWLIENHGISVSVVADYYSTVVYNCWIMTKNGDEYTIELSNPIDTKFGIEYYETTYKEALEKGLLKGLELINGTDK